MFITDRHISFSDRKKPLSEPLSPTTPS